MSDTSVKDDRLVERATVAQGIRILVREGLIPNFGHIGLKPPGTDWFWTLHHVHVGLDLIGPDDIIACDMKGKTLRDSREAPGERFIYTEIFARRPDVSAIAHFHPPMAIAFSIARKPILPVLMLAGHVGEVPQYDVPEQIVSPQDGQALADALGQANAVLLEGHGAVTVGRSVKEVCALAVLLEHNARMQHLAETLGDPRVIETKSRAKVYEAGFREFCDVLWEHHQQPNSISFLGQQVM